MPQTITDKELSSGARHLYHALKDFARGKNWPECWPHLWRICENVKKSRRMVLYYLAELESFGAIQRIRTAGKGGRYRLLLDLNEKIGEWMPVALVQPIAPVLVQPIAPVEDCSNKIEETTAASRAVVETPALAAEKNSQGEEMGSRTKNAFAELLKLGLPASTEMENRIALNPDHAREVLAHCKRRFSPGRKPVDNKGGYISALLCNPGKFGWVQTDGVWIDPEKPSGPTAEDVSARIAASKAASKAVLARSQAAAEEAYADMKGVWERLPAPAKQEIRDFVLNASPLLHASGANAAEFELQCMSEAFSLKRTIWRRKYLVPAPQQAPG